MLHNYGHIYVLSIEPIVFLWSLVSSSHTIFVLSILVRRLSKRFSVCIDFSSLNFRDPPFIESIATIMSTNTCSATMILDYHVAPVFFGTTHTHTHRRSGLALVSQWFSIRFSFAAKDSQYSRGAFICIHWLILPFTELCLFNFLLC